MKKWDQPQLVDLNVKCTKEGTCTEDFEAKTAYGFKCDKIKPDGTKAYEPSIALGICKYYGGRKVCNYISQHQS